MSHIGIEIGTYHVTLTKILSYCSYVSDALAANTSLKAESWQANLCGAVLSGFVVAVVINPLDVVTTRLYNQPAQVLGYSSNEAILHGHPSPYAMKQISNTSWQTFLTLLFKV